MELKPNESALGILLDGVDHNLPRGFLTYALNANIQSLDGVKYAYTNELANQLCHAFKPGFKVIGYRFIIEQSRVIFALVNPDTGESEIAQITNLDFDCLKLTTTEQECSDCKKGIIISEEITVEETDYIYPCAQDNICEIYEYMSPDISTGSDQAHIEWTDCSGKFHDIWDTFSTTGSGTFTGFQPFQVLNGQIKSPDNSAIFIRKYAATYEFDCEDTVIRSCCRYDTIIDSCLNFSINSPVYFRHKSNNCDTTIYFVTKNGPPRYLSLSLPLGEDACGKPNSLLNCEDLNIFPNTCHPKIIPISITDGGELRAGTYRATIAYTDKLGNEYTDYFDLSPEVSIFERKITIDTDYLTSKSITFNIKHNTDLFDYFNLVIEETINQTSNYFLAGTFRVIDGNHIYTGFNKQEFSSVKTLIRTPHYETAGIIESSDDVLMLADLEADIEYNLQPLVTLIPVKWETVSMPVHDDKFNYANGVVAAHFRGYPRDENFGIGIKFKWKKGGKYSRIFPLIPPIVPGINALVYTPDTKDVFYDDPNCPSLDKLPVWKVYNTAINEGSVPNCVSDDTIKQEFDCEIHPHQKGKFGYFESTQTYPCNEEVWGVNAGKPIRLFKFPDCAISPIHNDEIPGQRFEIYPIGIRPDLDAVNDLINDFLIYNPKTKKKDILLKDLICGFEIVRTNRVGNKSVLSKGLVFDVGKFTDSENNRTYFYPNYPLNDLREDPFLSKNSDVYSHSDLTPAEEAALRFTAYPPGAPKDRYTYHSPDIHFQYPVLGTEMKIESYEYGTWAGHFVPVDHHPKYKFLTKFDFALATTLGVVMSTKLHNESVTDGSVTAGVRHGGGQEWDISAILGSVELFKDIIEKGIPKINYAWQYNCIGTYNRSKFPLRGDSRRRLELGVYLSPNNQTIGDDYPVWNYQRESSVYCKIQTGFFDSPILGLPQDNSRNTLSSFGTDWCSDPTSIRNGEVQAKYVSLKRVVPDQYGAVENFHWVNTGDFYKMDTLGSGNGYFPCKFYPTFGGDTFINEFFLKRKMPFWTQNMVGRPDEIDFDYQLVPNVAYPTYYIGTSPDSITIQDLFRHGAGVELLIGFTALLIGSLVPEGTTQKALNIAAVAALSMGGATLFYNVLSAFVAQNNLDCDPGESKTDKLIDIDLSNPLNPKFNSVLFDAIGGNPFYQQGKFYTAAYGIPRFIVESDVNVSLRHGRNEKEENFVPNVGTNIPDDWLQEFNVPIKFDNYYSYNRTYSKQLYENFNESFNDFKPDEICKSAFPNSLIYSDEASREDQKDSWLSFRTNNYFEFPKTNGKLISINSVENSKVLARFENTTQAFNARIIIDSNSPQQLELGTGSIFNQKPTDYVNADLGYLGTQNKAFVSCKHGQFWTDAKRGFVYQIGPKSFDEISNTNFNWFKQNLPFHILKDFPTYPVDNAFKDVGISMVWDERFERVFVTKKDYRIIPEFKNALTYNEALNRFETNTGSPVSIENPDFFENKSWTLAYSPITKNWISFYSFLPKYYVGLTSHFQSGNDTGLWNHGLSPLKYQTYYNELCPYILEWPVPTLPNVAIVNAVCMYQDIQKFYNKTDFYSLGSVNSDNDVNFNKAILFNKEQCSGLLSLNHHNPNSLRERYSYPRVNNDRFEILYGHREQKFTFNGFFDAVNNTRNNQPIFITDWDELRDSYYIDKTLNPKAFLYTLRQQQMHLRSKECRVRVIQDKHDRYRFINYISLTQTNNSLI